MSVVALQVTDLATAHLGKSIKINGFGAAVSQNIVIEIISPEGEQIQELTVTSTGAGDFSTIWLVSKDTPPGTYTIKVRDAFDSVETTIDLE